MLHAVLTKFSGKAGKFYMQYSMTEAWKFFLELKFSMLQSYCIACKIYRPFLKIL